MLILFKILALLVAVFIHEYAHLRAMVRANIQIQEVQFGFLIPGVRPLWTTHFPGYPGIPFIIGHIPLFAWVRTTPEGGKQSRKLPYRESVLIDGAGVWANLLTALVVSLPLIPLSLAMTPLMAGLFVTVLLLTIFWIYFREGICRYFMPFFSFFSLFLFSLGTIILFSGLAQAGASDTAPAVTVTSLLYLVLGSLMEISLVLGVLNALPMAPLDGGHIIASLLRKYWPQAEEPYLASSFFIFLFLVFPILLFLMCV